MAASFTVTTRSGQQVNLLIPQPEGVRLSDIAHHLSHIARYNGAAEQRISVAQHCHLVSRALERFGPRLSLLGLLHDAHEYVMGDIVSPMREMIEYMTGSSGFFDGIEARHNAAIWQACHITPPTTLETEAIRRADMAARTSEWAKAMPGPCPYDEPPCALPWAFLSPDRAEQAFLTRFETLAAAIPGTRKP